ncbi:MAG: acetylxylan esterase [Verrucomicrobia bacterium]|nr:acetylxylan esterase [Verrucomicrobiota bacterium]
MVAPETKWAPLRERDHFYIERMLYTSRPGRTVDALLALPREARNKPVPVILALHGHEATWGQAALEAFDLGHADDFCHYFASNGFAVLETPTMDHRLQNENWTLYGEWVWDAIAGLNAITERPEIDRTRVGVIGLSTGALLAELVAALDKRPCGAVIAGIFSTRNHFRRRIRIPPHCDCGFSKCLAPHIEQCDVAALAVPKTMQIQHGKQDHCFCPGADPSHLKLDWNTGVMPPEEFDAAVEEVKRAYKIAGATDRFSTHIHPGGHAVDNVAALEWISKAVRAGGEGE